MNFKKSDIAKNISSKSQIPYSLSEQIVNNFIDLIKSKSYSNVIKIANFGTFSKKVTPQRIGRNPKTGEKHVITERTKLKFIVSNKVKKQLN